MAQADGRRPLNVEVRFNSWPVHVESVVDSRIKFFLEVFQLSPVRIIPHPPHRSITDGIWYQQLTAMLSNTLQSTGQFTNPYPCRCFGSRRLAVFPRAVRQILSILQNGQG